MPEELKIYPELVYYRTKVLKLSVADVIKGLDMSEYTYLRCENGKRELTLSEAFRISKNMNLEMDVLFPKFFNS